MFKQAVINKTISDQFYILLYVENQIVEQNNNFNNWKR